MSAEPAPTPTLHDIKTRADCERLVRAFYSKALSDPIIGWLFTDVAKLDLEAHVPQITSFWETILLGARSYGGGAFAPHAGLHARVGLRAGHFQRWLALWTATVDELFVGERAELAKAHAQRVARAFHSRLETILPGGPAAAQARATAAQAETRAAPAHPGSLGLTVTRHGPGTPTTER